MARKDRTGNRKTREQKKQFWMYAYFGSMPVIQDSRTCCSDFGRIYEAKTGQKYSKADERLYEKICRGGCEEKAMQIVQKRTVEFFSGMVYNQFG